jgi:hypothetical protein
MSGAETLKMICLPDGNILIDLVVFLKLRIVGREEKVFINMWA